MAGTMRESAASVNSSRPRTLTAGALYNAGTKRIGAPRLFIGL